MSVYSKKRMNHIGILIIVALFISPSIPILNSSPTLDDSDQNVCISKNIHIVDTKDYSSGNNVLLLSDNNMTLQISNNGLEPVLIETIIIPRNAVIRSIDVIYDEVKEYRIKNSQGSEHLLYPQPNNKLLNEYVQHVQSLIIQDGSTEIKRSDNELFDYAIGCGISKGEKVLFVTITCFPQSYTVPLNTMQFPSSISYSVSYELVEEEPARSQQAIDLVIICPNEFSQALVPLIDHKNAIGINTLMKTTEDIFREYDGRDDAESVKLFIKDALDDWDITYVLLVGGLKGQSSRWYVPVRYSHLHDRSFWNDSYVTDLYFADIYRYNTDTHAYEFDDWDSNGNSVFAEWTWIYDPDRGWWYDLDKKDNLDLYPDVALGRLACRSIEEVNDVVDKIIYYESNTFNEEWFNSVILCGGDTVPYSDGICEGEIENEYAATFLEPLGFEMTRLWVSLGTLSGASDIVRALNKGAGFLYLSGHGTPREWCTHPISDADHWIDAYSYQMDRVNNNYKLPICVVGGCHNSQFDVSLSRIPQGIASYGLPYFFWNEGIDCFFKWTWVPSCWSWNLISQKNDGCIAVIGNTGLGWGVGGERCTEYNEGYLTSHFFQIYASLSQQGYNQLGIIHQEALTDFISHFSANSDLLDRKTVEEWVLLGDPSLQIGGIPNN